MSAAEHGEDAVLQGDDEPVSATKMPAPYYEDDFATIYHGDCMDILPRLSDIDLVFTSPPYNLGTSSGGGMHATSGKGAGGYKPTVGDLAGGYGEHEDAMPADDYERWQRRFLLACWETLSAAGAIFYNHKPRIQDGIAQLPTTFGSGLPLRQIIVWDREKGLNFSPSFFLPKHEWIVVWARSEFRLRDKKSSAIGDVWRVPPEDSTRHPAPFPLGLPARAIEAVAPSVVLDPFMGSGTTLRAAKDAGVRSVGIELDERHCQTAVKRLAQDSFAFGGVA